MTATMGMFPGVTYDPAASRAARDRSADVARKRADRNDARDVDVPAPENMQRRLDLEGDHDARALLRWMSARFPAVFYKPHGRDQEAWAEDILHVMREGGKKAIGAPRGRGKSAFLKAAEIFGIMLGMIRHGVILCNNQAAANARLRELKSMLATPEFADDYPEIGAFVAALEGTAQRAGRMLYKGEETDFLWQSDQIVFPWLPDLAYVKCSNAVIRAVGIKGHIRGSTYATRSGELLRVDNILLDDPSDKKMASSQTMTTETMEYIDGDVGGLAAQGGKMAQFAIVTRIEPNDVASQLLDREIRPDWNGTTNQLIESMPENIDLLAEYEQLVFECMVAGKTDGDGLCEETVTWWRLHQDRIEKGARVCSDHLHIPPPPQTPKAVSSIHWAISKRAVMSRAAFEAEYQNNPTASHVSAGLAVAPVIVQKRTTGLSRGICPAGFDVLTVGVDIGSQELHAVATAWNVLTEQGHVVDYWTVPVNAEPGDGDIRDRHSVAHHLLAEALPRALGRVEDRHDLIPDHPNDTHHFGQPYRLNTDTLKITTDPRYDRYLTPYRRRDGSAKSPDAVFVDVGYMADPVHAFCEARRNRRWAAVRGAPAKRIPQGNRENLWIAHDSGYWIKTVNVTVGRDGVASRHLLYHNADDNKRRAQEGWIVPLESAGSLSLFGAHGREHAEFADHVCAEAPVEKSPGNVVWMVKNPSNPSNHFLDALALSLAAFRVLRDEGQGWIAPSSPVAALASVLAATDRAAPAPVPPAPSPSPGPTPPPEPALPPPPPTPPVVYLPDPSTVAVTPRTGMTLVEPAPQKIRRRPTAEYFDL